MSRLDNIQEGTCTIEDLAYWINERHNIYVNRFEKNLPKPWTDDKILQQYKFTNCFRQLDKGTIALQKMLASAPQNVSPALIFFNVVWYRLFNWYEYAEELGFVTDFYKLEKYIAKRFKDKKKIFTGAHMTSSVAYEYKHITYLRAVRGAWDNRDFYTDGILASSILEGPFYGLLSLYMAGRFVAYEIICDLRFTELLENATDKLTWANMGPGAQRGLKRLGMLHKTQEDGVESMQKLYSELSLYLSCDVLRHIHKGMQNEIDPPFELREVEHSLCEFDKYQRVKRGEGRPRSRYPGI